MKCLCPTFSWKQGPLSLGVVYFLFLVSWGGVRLSPLGTVATVWPIVPAPDDDHCGAIRGMRIGRGNRSTRRNPAPVPLCPPQIPHDLTWARTQDPTVGSRRLTTWDMWRPALSVRTSSPASDYRPSTSPTPLQTLKFVSIFAYWCSRIIPVPSTNHLTPKC
jgi:hypothetical protein